MCRKFDFYKRAGHDLFLSALAKSLLRAFRQNNYLCSFKLHSIFTNMAFYLQVVVYKHVYVDHTCGKHSDKVINVYGQVTVCCV